MVLSLSVFARRWQKFEPPTSVLEQLNFMFELSGGMASKGILATTLNMV